MQSSEYCVHIRTPGGIQNTMVDALEYRYSEYCPGIADSGTHGKNPCSYVNMNRIEPAVQISRMDPIMVVIVKLYRTLWIEVQHGEKGEQKNAAAHRRRLSIRKQQLMIIFFVFCNTLK